MSLPTYRHDKKQKAPCSELLKETLLYSHLGEYDQAEVAEQSGLDLNEASKQVLQIRYLSKHDSFREPGDQMTF